MKRGRVALRYGPSTLRLPPSCARKSSAAGDDEVPAYQFTCSRVVDNMDS
jgi:hypothetical protein